MRVLRFLALAAVVLFAASSSAQYPQAWSSFRDQGQPTSEFARKACSASGGGYFVFGADQGSSVLSRVDDAGATLWTRTIQGEDGDMAANAAGVATISYVDRESAFRNTATIQRFGLAGNIIWSKTLAPAHSPTQFGNHVALDAAGNVIVAESYFSTSSLKKFDAMTGSQIFDFQLPAGTRDSFVHCASDGSIFIGGRIAIGNQPGAGLSRYNSAGNLIWSRSFAGTHFGTIWDASNNSYLLFWSGSAAHVAKVAPDGTIVWDTTLPAPGAGNMSISPSGAVALCGSNGVSASVMLLNANGVFQWSKPISTKPGPVAIDSAGNFFAYSYHPVTPSLVKFDPSGNIIWTKTNGLTSPGFDAGLTDMFIDPIDRAVLLGPSSNGPTSYDMALRVFNPDGNSPWQANIDDAKCFDSAINSVTDAAGNTFVTGLGSSTFAITKFLPSGTPGWTRDFRTFREPRRYSGPCLTPDGGVVAGFSWDPSDPNANLCVFKFDASGNLLWTHTNFIDQLYIKDIKVGLDGSVFVCHANYDPDGPAITLRVMKLTAGGAVAWIRDIPGQFGSTYDDRATLAVDANGSVYASYSLEAFYDSSTINKAALQKIDAAGNLAWSKVLDSIFVDGHGDGVAINSQGHVLWVARHSDPTRVDDELLYKFDSSGNVLGLIQVADIEGPILKIDSADNVFLGGLANYAVGQEYPAVQKITSSHTSAWLSWITDNNTYGVDRLVPDNLGGAFYALPTRTATSYTHRVYRFAANGSRAWNVNGGFFTGGSLIHDTGVLDKHFDGMSVDAIGNLYVSGSMYAPASSGSHDISLIKYAARNSAFVTQAVPANMVAGQSYFISTTFQNTGIETWTLAEGHKLGIINSPLWGVVSAPLAATDSIAPGQTKKFGYYIYAPTTPGVYSYQSRMYKRGSSVGPLSPSASVTVSMAADASRYVSQYQPKTVKVGSTFAIRVTMRNVGTNTWTVGGSYVLAPASGYPTWGVTAVPLAAGDSIGNGGEKAFIFNITAPTTPGTYDVRFQMKKGGAFFGDRTTLKSITVN